VHPDPVFILRVRKRVSCLELDFLRVVDGCSRFTDFNVNTIVWRFLSRFKLIFLSHRFPSLHLTFTRFYLFFLLLNYGLRLSLDPLRGQIQRSNPFPAHFSLAFSHTFLRHRWRLFASRLRSLPSICKQSPTVFPILLFVFMRRSVNRNGQGACNESY